MTYDPVCYWNKRAEKEGAEWKPHALDNLVNWYLSYFGTDNVASALDVGCAWGRALRRFKQRNVAIDMTMCDISETYLEICRKEHNVEPDLWDGKTLPYNDESFNLVISNSLLVHVPYKMIQRVWDEQMRVSKRFIFIGTNHGSSRKNVGGHEGIGKKLAPHCFFHDYKALIEDSNLKILNELFFSNKVNWWLEKPCLHP